jgi:hypothetical protein
MPTAGAARIGSTSAGSRGGPPESRRRAGRNRRSHGGSGRLEKDLRPRVMRVMTASATSSHHFPSGGRNPHRPMRIPNLEPGRRGSDSSGGAVRHVHCTHATMAQAGDTSRQVTGNVSRRGATSARIQYVNLQPGFKRLSPLDLRSPSARVTDYGRRERGGTTRGSGATIRPRGRGGTSATPPPVPREQLPSRYAPRALSESKRLNIPTEVRQRPKPLGRRPVPTAGSLLSRRSAVGGSGGILRPSSTAPRG